MEKQQVIDCHYELEQLQEMYQNTESEIAIVYGRRRVGKTFLMKECFMRATKTRKALQYVLVTTYGLRRNKYSQIFQTVVTMDDLFE